jgi:hypothetical protein
VGSLVNKLKGFAYKILQILRALLQESGG